MEFFGRAEPPRRPYRKPEEGRALLLVLSRNALGDQPFHFHAKRIGIADCALRRESVANGLQLRLGRGKQKRTQIGGIVERGGYVFIRSHWA